MSERFVSEGKDILQYGEWWCSAGGEHCADVIATALNMILDENERLKNVVGYNYEEHKRCVDNYVDKIKEVEKENENIKKVLINKRKEVIDDYDRSAKAGMPTGGIIGEIDLLETIMEEIGIGDEDE